MLGIDIVEIQRFLRLKQNQNFMAKVFCEKELQYYEESGQRAETLAGMWACKESVIKALGSGRTVSYKDICILHTLDGKPYIEKTEKLSFPIEITISHSETHALSACFLLDEKAFNAFFDKSIEAKVDKKVDVCFSKLEAGINDLKQYILKTIK